MTLYRVRYHVHDLAETLSAELEVELLSASCEEAIVSARNKATLVLNEEAQKTMTLIKAEAVKPNGC